MIASGATLPIAAPPTPSEAEVYFETVWQAAESTLARGVVATDRFALGGRTVQVRSILPDLREALTAALRHQAVAAGPVDLDLIAWETSSGGVPFPMFPREPGDQLLHGRVLRFCDAQHVVLWEAHYGLFILVQVATGRAIFAIEHAARYPYEERAAPLKSLLSAWMGLIREGQIVHGAAVARGDRGLLLTAPGGSGKSTTALLALQAGWEYLADDWCLITQDGPPRLHSLYHTAKLHWNNVHRVSAVESLITNHAHAAEQKALMTLGDSPWGGQFRAEAALVAIVIPQIADREDTTFTRINGLRTFHAMTLVTVRSICGCGRETIDRLTRLAQAAPVYSLALGRDLAQIPPALDRILAGHL